MPHRLSDCIGPIIPENASRIIGPRSDAAKAASVAFLGTFPYLGVVPHVPIHSYRKIRSMKGIPVLHVEGDCISRAWENSLIELHKHGCRIKTQYDKPEDPASIDATMLIT